MSNAATLNMMAKASSDEAARAATLAKKAAQARARHAKKKGNGTPELFNDESTRARRITAAESAQAQKKIDAAAPLKIEAVKVPERTDASKKTKPRVKAAPTPAAKQGGAREGAGRKALYGDEVMHMISFRGTTAHRDEFKAAGGGNWVRAGLDERIAFKAKGGK